MSGELRTDGGQLTAPGTSRVAVLAVVDVLERGRRAAVYATDDLVGIHHVAEILGVNQTTAGRLVERGELRTEPGGTHRRIRATEVDQYRDYASIRRPALDDLATDITPGLSTNAFP